MINFTEFKLNVFFRYCFYGSCFFLGLTGLAYGNIFDDFEISLKAVIIIGIGGAILTGVSVFAAFVLKELIKDLLDV